MEVYKGEIYDCHQHFWIMDGSQPRGPKPIFLRQLREQGKSEEIVNQEAKNMSSAFHSFAGNVERWINDYLPPDWQREGEGLNVTKTTQVDGGWIGNPVDEVGFQQQLFQKYGNPCVAIGYCDLTDPNCHQVLEEQQKFSIFRGVRISVSHHANPEVLYFATPKLLENPKFRRGVAVLASKNLILEVWCYSHQLPELTKLADEFPSLRIVLNHFGTPVNIKDNKVLVEWRKDLAELAKRKNVMVKVSGFGLPVVGISYSPNPTSEEIAQKIRPYFHFVLQQFSFDRSLFASNFPVDGALLSYKNMIEAYKILLREAGVSLEDQRKFFFSNSMNLYKP